MSKVTMLEPVASIRRTPSAMNYKHISSLGVSLGSHMLITTTQAEAYADARVAESRQWQPIDTAPQDGTAVLVANENGAWIAKYDPVYQSGYRPANPWFSLMLNHDHVRKGRPYAPTHWMPLPAPPQQSPDPSVA